MPLITYLERDTNMARDALFGVDRRQICVSHPLHRCYLLYEDWTVIIAEFRSFVNTGQEGP